MWKRYKNWFFDKLSRNDVESVVHPLQQNIIKDDQRLNVERSVAKVVPQCYNASNKRKFIVCSSQFFPVLCGFINFQKEVSESIDFATVLV